jgi:hypothetical protein
MTRPLIALSVIIQLFIADNIAAANEVLRLFAASPAKSLHHRKNLPNDNRRANWRRWGSPMKAANFQSSLHTLWLATPESRAL